MVRLGPPGGALSISDSSQFGKRLQKVGLHQPVSISAAAAAVVAAAVAAAVVAAVVVVVEEVVEVVVVEVVSQQ